MELEIDQNNQQSATDTNQTQTAVTSTTINQLKPYVSFLIKARITHKSHIAAPSGAPKVFCADIIDREGQETTVFFFGEAAEFFHPKLEENEVYIFKNGAIKTIDKLCKMNADGYQISYEEIDLDCIKKVENIARALYNKLNLIKLRDIQTCELNSIVDVAVFVKNIEPTPQMTQKTLSKMKKTLHVYDDSRALSEMTFWGQDAANVDFPLNQLIVIKGAKVSDYSGKKNLASNFGTRVFTNLNELPSDPVIEQLLEWKNSRLPDEKLDFSINTTSQTKTTIYTIEEMMNMLLQSESPLLFDLNVHINYIDMDRPGTIYAACENSKKCGRKAISEGRGEYYTCKACNNTFKNPVYRYNLHVKISDSTGAIWITVLDKIANIILGIDAKKLKEVEEGNKSHFARVFTDALQKEYKLTVLAKNEHPGNLKQVKIQAHKIEQIDYKQFTAGLIESLQGYENK